MKRASGEKRRAWRRGALLVVLASSLMGCFFMRDPLDPRGQLDHRVVKQFADAERITRTHQAFARARERAPRVQPGMSVDDVEIAMQAIVVTEQREDVDQEGPRRRFIDGLLCRRNPTPLSERWLFGYDEGGVELVGFAIEFARDNPEKDNWRVRTIDRAPADDCPDAGE